MICFRFVGVVLIVIVKANLDFIQAQINKYSQIDLILTSQRHHEGKALLDDPEIEKYENKKQEEKFQLPQFKEHCHIFENSQEFLFINTLKATYIGINTFNPFSFLIFNTQCQKISSFPNINIKSVICDHGLCLENEIYFLSEDGKILRCEKTFNYAECFLLEQINQTITGATVKMSQQKNIIVATENLILFFSEKGNIRKNITFGTYETILQFQDFHPFPVILSNSGWMYFLDVKNQKILPSKCPFMRNLNHLQISNAYESTVYGFTNSSIFLIQLKYGEKSCQIQERYSPSIQLSLVNKQRIEGYKGLIYLQNEIINPKSHSSFSYEDCREEAFFKFEKTKNQNPLMLINCCRSEKQCLVKVLKEFAPSNSSTSYPFLFTFLVLMIFFFFMLKLIKSLKRKSDIEADIDYEKFQLKKKNR